MKILQINSTKNAGSTGRIAEEIGKKIIEGGGDSIIAFGRGVNTGLSTPIKAGNAFDQSWHLLNTRFFDTHGFHSTLSTKKLIAQIKSLNPDLIHLHNLHGYYLDVEVLFRFLASFEKPIVWTFHDCWPFTGHCCYYERVKCLKWQTECKHCPLTHLYPQSWVFDNSQNNFRRKKAAFLLLENIHLVTVSHWLESQVKKSFLQDFPLQTIYNGVDLDVFKPSGKAKSKLLPLTENKKVILGVANVWSEGKGFNTFLELSKMLEDDQVILLIGLNKKQMKKLPGNVIGLERTSGINELADYYRLADVFVNPSMAETFGMVTAEAMACGTPSVVYDSSAMPELITDGVGFVVEPGNVLQLSEKINQVLTLGKNYFANHCRKRAESLFSKDKQVEGYYSLYQSLI